MVINILLKALTAEPFPDFNLCISLLDDRPVNATLDEPDPLPTLLPLLTNLYNLLHQCRFSAFWTLYRSDELEVVRENYTVECAGFEDAIREVAARSVKATFTRIGSERLGSYVDLSGRDKPCAISSRLIISIGPKLEAWVAKQRWTLDPSTGVVSIPLNPDNQVESVVIQEHIKLPREFHFTAFIGSRSFTQLYSELGKVISHSVQTK